MPKALKDVKKTAEKEEDQKSEAKDVDLKEFLGVPVYELTNRDETAQVALSAKFTCPVWGMVEYEKALDTYLNARYPWRRIRTEKASKTSDQGVFQATMRDIHLHAIEKDFGSLLQIATEMHFFHFSLKDYPPRFLPPSSLSIFKERNTDLQRSIFCFNVSSAIGRLEILWDSLRIIPEVADQLNQMDKIIQQLCLFRDYINYDYEPESPTQEGLQRGTTYIRVHITSAARCAYFMLQFIAYTYLNTESKCASSGEMKYKDFPVSMADFNELYQSIAAGGEDLSMLEENTCDKLCEIFKLKSREEAKKHDWFKFFTFKDWTWLLGPQRSFLDWVGSAKSSSAAASSDPPVDGSHACRCDGNSGEQTCPDCIGKIKGMLLRCQKVIRLHTDNIRSYETLYSHMLTGYTRYPCTGFSSDEALTTLHKLAMEVPRYVAYVINSSLCNYGRTVKRFETKLKFCATPGPVLQLTYLGLLALLRSFTYETAVSIASDDISLEKDTEHIRSSLSNLHRQVDNFTVWAMKLLRDLK